MCINENSQECLPCTGQSHWGPDCATTSCSLQRSDNGDCWPLGSPPLGDVQTYKLDLQLVSSSKRWPTFYSFRNGSLACLPLISAAPSSPYKSSINVFSTVSYSLTGTHIFPSIKHWKKSLSIYYISFPKGGAWMISVAGTKMTTLKTPRYTFPNTQAGIGWLITTTSVHAPTQQPTTCA